MPLREEVLTGGAGHLFLIKRVRDKVYMAHMKLDSCCATSVCDWHRPVLMPKFEMRQIMRRPNSKLNNDMVNHSNCQWARH